MADSYLNKITINLDKEALARVTGTLSEEFGKMGAISSKFADDQFAEFQKRTKQLANLNNAISDVEKHLGSATGKAAEYYKSMLDSLHAQVNGVIAGGKGELSIQELKAVTQATADSRTPAPVPEKKHLFRDLFGKFESGLNTLTSKIAKVGEAYNAAAMMISKYTSKISSALSSFSNYSSQLNPMGAFGSKTMRGYMTRYGMTSSQALGFANTLDALNMDESDIGNMTGSQRQVFNELQSYWSKLMGTMDADKVKKFSKTMEQYQLIQAKFNMGLQATVMKLITNSPKFEQFMGKLENMMDTTLDFLSSDAMQWVFDNLVDFLSAIVTILDKFMKLVSKIPFLGSTSNTTNNNTTTNNNYTVYGLDSFSQNETARQISYATNSGGYQG